jgi:hypothetical protein
MIQKNFAAYGQNCDQAAEEFLRAKNVIRFEVNLALLWTY